MTPLPETPAYIQVMVRQLLRERGNWRKRLKHSKRYTDLNRNIKHELAVAGHEVGDFELERILMSYNRRPTEDEALGDEDPVMNEALREILDETLDRAPTAEDVTVPAEKPAKRGGRRKYTKAKTVAASSPVAVTQAATAPPAPPLPPILTTTGPEGLAIFRMEIQTNLPGFEELVKALANRIGVECR